MNRVWEKEYDLRGSDFDKFNRIKPSAVLDLFQDAAGQHAEELGVGFDAMAARDYLWVLVRIRFRILAQPKSYQRVTVRTWPLAPGKVNYRRECCIEDANGERLIMGSSEWVVIHREKRSFVSAPDLYPFSDGFHDELMFEGRLGKLRTFEAVKGPYTVNAGFSELDANDHVNNTKYANYVLDAISPAPDDELEQFQIDYRKEVLQGVQLGIYHARKDDVVWARGENTDGETMFACELKYKAR